MPFPDKNTAHAHLVNILLSELQACRVLVHHLLNVHHLLPKTSHQNRVRLVIAA